MCNTNSKKSYDDYELKENYDFTGAVRSRFYKPKKISTTLRLDNDIRDLCTTMWRKKK